MFRIQRNGVIECDTADEAVSVQRALNGQLPKRFIIPPTMPTVFRNKKARRSARQGSKRAAVLSYLQEHPEASPVEVSAALIKSGVHVGANYVSTIKSSIKRRSAVRNGRPGAKGAVKTKSKA